MRPGDIAERLAQSACPLCASRSLSYSDYAGCRCGDCERSISLAEAYLYGLRLSSVRKEIDDASA